MRLATVIDFEIPARYGRRLETRWGLVESCLRTAPVLVDIARDMLALCPDAIMLQYAIRWRLSGAVLSGTRPEICGTMSVQGTALDLARDLGESLDDIEYECTIMSLFIRNLRNGMQMVRLRIYPRLQALVRATMAWLHKSCEI